MSTMMNGNADEAPSKRMRLGTRSCAECRRRKIRCVFPDNATICESCALHAVSCTAQQPKRSEKRTLSQNDPGGTKKRLDEMEAMIRQMYGAIAQGSSPLPNQSHPSALETSSPGFRNLTLGSRTQSTSPFSYEAQSTPSTSDSIPTHETQSEADSLDQFGKTPLVSLFNEALLLQKTDDSRNVDSHSTRHQNREFLRLIPPTNLLEKIIEATRKHWCTWPPCFFGSQRLQEASNSDMLSFVLTSVNSEMPSLAAKALLWLSLCIFELPRSFTTQYASIAQAHSLIGVFMEQSTRLLSIASEQGDSIDSIEALGLEIKLNVDLGRPRKAWLGARRAVNTSLLLGLHRMDTSQRRRETDMWRLVLHVDRETSLMLGVPPSISNATGDILPSSQGLFPMEKLMFKVMMISGAVAERNQGNLDTSYSKTIELDQDWENCKKIMPDDFWHATPPPGLSFGELFHRQTTKIRFFVLGKMIHLPYMLKSSKERKYALSRASCLDASREAIIAYQNLREAADPELAPCGYMDFESFSASMVIMINLLQQRYLQKFEQEQNVQDIMLLRQLLPHLRQASTLQECTVAEQAANIMDVLLPVLQGAGWKETVDQGYDVTIRYLGQLKITFPEVGSNDPSPASIAGPAGNQSFLPPMPAIEFGTTIFDENVFSNFDVDAELSGDWSTSFEANNYDWITILQQNPI